MYVYVSSNGLLLVELFESNVGTGTATVKQTTSFIVKKQSVFLFCYPPQKLYMYIYILNISRLLTSTILNKKLTPGP